MERGEKEIGAEILLRISRQFGKSLEWLLVGDDT
jgi:plasmid maintenance system antidote protein VapI